MDRRAFLGGVGALGAARLLSMTEKAEAVEMAMMQRLGRSGGGGSEEEDEPLAPMPERPTLVDFFNLRFRRGIVRHCLQSAQRAIEHGYTEEQTFACLLHDLSLNLIRPDHGWWGAQLFEPYVSEKVSWAIRYHQALRFYPDPDVGYEYPEMYHRIFGKDYVPDPYIEAAYRYARGHKWYMEARLITVNDDYSFDPDKEVSLDPFIDMIGRNFRQPKEGLGYDNSPVAHMWRTLIFPNRRL